MDDVIVEFNHDDTRRRLSLQVKRRITISAAASNTDFRQIMAGCCGDAHYARLSA